MLLLLLLLLLSFCFRLIKIGAAGGGGLGVSGLTAFLVWYFEFRNVNHRPAARGKYENQTVATDTLECSEIGNKILTKKGSAVDAAVAAMFCLGVINMHSSGIGGGGVMLVYNRSAKAASIIDFREAAPLIVSNFTPNATGVNESRFGLYRF